MNSKRLPRSFWLVGAFLLYILALRAWANPPARLVPDDGSAMFIADDMTLLTEAGSTRINSTPDDDYKIPLFLIHGIDREHVPGLSLEGGWRNFATYFQSTPALANNYKLYIVGYSSNVVSVDKLGDDFGRLLGQLDQWTHGLQNKHFVVIAHSMGGLVSRAMMNKQQGNGARWGERVLNLITLATPHHGTPVANSIDLGPLERALRRSSRYPQTLVASHVAWKVPSTSFNRRDLFHDNSDNLFQYIAGDGIESTPWLRVLNSDSTYNSKLILHAGSYVSGTHPDYNTPIVNIQAILSEGLMLPSDGVVPVSSAYFDNAGIANSALRIMHDDYDHTQMWQGHECYNPASDPSADGLFQSIGADLTKIAAMAPVPFSISASSQSANSASYVQITTTAHPLAGETYTLFRDGQPYKDFDGRSFQNTQVSPGATYSYYVRAVNAVGTATSNTVSVTVLSPTVTQPASPSNLTVIAVSANQTSLSWKDNSSIETGYIVERKTGQSGSFTQLSGSPFPANTMACFDAGLSPGTLYYYRVTAAAATNSLPSDEVSVFTPGATLTTRVLTVSSSNPGSGVHVFLSPNDVNGLADGDTSFSRQYTTAVTATLVAPVTWNGGAFQKWQKDGQDTTASTVANVLMDGSHTMTAVYAAPQNGAGYAITVGASPSNGGTVSGGGTYTANSPVTIQATAAPGYTFLNWTRNTSSSNGGATFAVQPQVPFTATSNLSLVANFTQDASTNYRITTTAEPANGGTASGGGSYSPSSNVNLSAQPAGGYVFDYWTENGGIISYIQSFQYSQVSRSHDFVAHFHVPAPGSVPDLAPRIDSYPRYVFAGGTGSFSSAITNKGALSSSPCNNYFRISASNSVVPPEFNLGFYSPGGVGSIPPGVSAGVSAGVTFPSSLAPGDYYLWMVIDPEGRDGEPAANRGDNNLAVPFTVVAAPAANGPDLVAHDFTVTPAIALPSGPLRVKGGIRNVGNAASAGFKYYVSISTSATVAPDRNALNASGVVPGLGIYVDAGADSSFALPSDLAAGNYYLWIMVDPENASGEQSGNQGNNNIILPLTIVQPLPAYTISVSASSGVDGSVSGGGVYSSGALVPVIATPTAGKILANWTENGSPVSTDLNYNFTAATDRTLVANFVAGFAVSPSAGNNGLISPNSSGLVAGGGSVTFSATPSTGYTVDQWIVNGSSAQTGGSGFVLSNVTADTTVQVTFKAFPPIALYQGGYRGLVEATPLANPFSGRLSLALNAKGAFSAGLVLGAQSYSRKGAFDVNHNAVVAISGTALKLLLQLDTDGQSDQITGMIMQNNVAVANVIVHRTVVGFSAKNPVPHAGRYTVCFPVDQAHLNDSTYPQGNGYGSVVVAATGSVAFAGALGDGTVVSAGGVLTTTGEFPLYISLYRAKGFASGWLMLHDSAAANQVDGTLTWFKSATLAPAWYPAAFSVEVAVEGSSYIAPPKQPQILPVGPATLTISGGNVSVNPGVKQLTIDALNKIKIVGSEKFTMTLAPATGLFAGTFLDAGNKLTTFKGAVLQNKNSGAGFFKGNSQTGGVDLSR